MLGLNKQFVKAFIQAMHKEFIARQTDIMNESLANKKGR